MTWINFRSSKGYSLEVAGCADVCLGQPLPLPLVFVLFDPPGEGGVHEVVHLRVVVKAMNIVDFGVFDVRGSHGQRRSWRNGLYGYGDVNLNH